MPSSPSAEDVVEQARSWLGVRWKHQGRDRAGVDCAGLLVCVLQTLGIPHTDRQDYREHPDSRVLMSHLRSNLILAADGARVPGRVAVFRERLLPCHIGILSRQRDAIHIIHARANRRLVIEEPLLDPDRSDIALAAVFDIPGVTPWES